MPNGKTLRHELPAEGRAFVEAYESLVRSYGYVIEGDRVRPIESLADAEANVGHLIDRMIEGASLDA